MRISCLALLAIAALSIQAGRLHAQATPVGDTVRPTTLVARSATSPHSLDPRAAGLRRMPEELSRSQSIEYSDWYERRLTIHKWASYATVPLFAFQYAAGRQLYDESTDAPGWAKNGHGVAATGIAALFGVNTVTGVWNMWDARKDPAGRKWRMAHGILMLAADGGFVATGLLAEKGERSPDDRRLHRNVAISSMAVATMSYLMMLPPFRRE